MTTIPISARRRGHAEAANARLAARESDRIERGFVAGPENRMVAAIFTKLVVEAEFPSGTNSLLLVGPTGSGKSHLACGLADRWAQRPDPPRVTYISALDFRRQLDLAIAARDAGPFREPMRGSQLLVIDDLHRLSTAPYVQEELLNTLDVLSADARLLVTSSHFPVAIPGLSPAIASRLAGGLILELAPLGREARAELLDQYLSALGRSMEPAAMELFAARVEGEAPQVLRAAAELCAIIPRHGTIDEAQMKRFLDARASQCRTTVEDIVKLVARYHKLSPRMIASSTRRRALVQARGVVIYLARRLLGTSFEQLGQVLGGRDHSTIMHSFYKFEETLPKDAQLKSSVEELQRLLRAA